MDSAIYRQGWPAITKDGNRRDFPRNEKFQREPRGLTSNEKSHVKTEEAFIPSSGRPTNFCTINECGRPLITAQQRSVWLAINKGKTERLRETKGFCERREISRETESLTRKPRSLTSH